MRDPYGDPTWLKHNVTRLALHRLDDGERNGKPLLLLHGLGERTPRERPPTLEAWPGPVYGLDFTGHGQSGPSAGGGYTAEILMGDADAALARIGPSTVLGRGLGAYVALMIAGGRAGLVRGAILCDGSGLAGGPIGAASTTVAVPPPGAPPVPDPWVVVELARDVRPPDYAADYARLAAAGSQVDPAITVCNVWLPPWLEAVVQVPGVSRASLERALSTYR